MLTKTQRAMKKLASLGGKATFKKHGKSHMSKIAKLRWKKNPSEKRKIISNKK